MIIKALQNRGAVKYFDNSATMHPESLELVLEAGRLAPSAYGLQPYRVVVVTNPEKRAALAPHCYNQPQITNCQALIIGQAWQFLTSKDIEQYMTDIIQQRGVSREELEPLATAISTQFLHQPQEQFHNWATHQAYLSLGFMLAAAAVENIGSSPMEGFDQAALDQALGTDAQYRSVFLLALGYRSSTDERSRWPRVRRPAPQWIQVF